MHRIILSTSRNILVKLVVCLGILCSLVYIVFDGYQKVTIQDKHNLIANNSQNYIKLLEKQNLLNIIDTISKAQDYNSSFMIPNEFAYIEWIPDNSAVNGYKFTSNHFTKADYDFTINPDIIDAFKLKSEKTANAGPILTYMCTTNCYLLIYSHMIVDNMNGTVVAAIKSQTFLNHIEKIYDIPILLIYTRENNAMDLDYKVSQKEWRELILTNNTSKYFNNIGIYRDELPQEFSYNDLINLLAYRKDIGTPTLIPIAMQDKQIGYEVFFLPKISFFTILREGMLTNYSVFFGCVILMVVIICRVLFNVIRISSFFKHNYEKINKYIKVKNRVATDETFILLSHLNESLKSNDEMNHELEELRDKLASFSNYDSVMGIPNVKWINEQIIRLQTELRLNSNLSIFFTQFTINLPSELLTDHKVAQKISESIIKCLKDRNYLAVIEPKVFALITTTIVELNDLYGVLNQIKSIIEEKYGNGENLIMKAGIVPIISSTINPNQILKKARTAYQYSSDQDSKDAYVLYRESMNKAIVSDSAFEANFRDAKEKGEIALRFDTYSDITSNSIKGIIPTTIWYKGDAKYFLDDFTEDIIHCGLNIEYSYWKIENTIHAAYTIDSETNSQMNIYIPLNYDQLLDPNILSFLDVVTIKYRVLPSRIYFVITESHFRNDINGCLGSCKALIHNGYNILISDFGSGYIDLDFVHENKIQAISLSGTLTNRMIDNEYDRYMITNNIKKLIRSNKFEIYGSNVDNVILIQTLKSIGVTNMQGKMFPNNKNVDDIISFIKEKQKA